MLREEAAGNHVVVVLGVCIPIMRVVLCVHTVCVCVCVCVCVGVGVCLCMCVCVRERAFLLL